MRLGVLASVPTTVQAAGGRRAPRGGPSRAPPTANRARAVLRLAEAQSTKRGDLAIWHSPTALVWGRAGAPCDKPVTWVCRRFPRLFAHLRPCAKIVPQQAEVLDRVSRSRGRLDPESCYRPERRRRGLTFLAWRPSWLGWSAGATICLDHRRRGRSNWRQGSDEAPRYRGIAAGWAAGRFDPRLVWEGRIGRSQEASAGAA